MALYTHAPWKSNSLKVPEVNFLMLTDAVKKCWKDHTSLTNICVLIVTKHMVRYDATDRLLHCYVVLYDETVQKLRHKIYKAGTDKFYLLIN
jgi:hypothetical protein